MERRLETVSFADLEGEGASVTYWVNAPSGRIRALTGLTRRIDVKKMTSKKKPNKNPTTAEMTELVDAYNDVLDMDDAIWAVLVGADGGFPLIEEWTLRGWGKGPDGKAMYPGPDVLPVSIAGLDALSGEVRQQVMERFTDAIGKAGSLAPQSGPISSSGAPAEIVPNGKVSFMEAVGVSESGE